MKIVYQSYLLRIWNTITSNYTDWHASVEEILTHKIETFNSSQELFEYLQLIIDQENSQQDEERK